MGHLAGPGIFFLLHLLLASLHGQPAIEWRRSNSFSLQIYHALDRCPLWVCNCLPNWFPQRSLFFFLSLTLLPISSPPFFLWYEKELWARLYRPLQREGNPGPVNSVFLIKKKAKERHKGGNRYVGRNIGLRHPEFSNSPTDSFTNLEAQNPPHNIPKKFTDFHAPKLWKSRSAAAATKHQ